MQIFRFVLSQLIHPEDWPLWLVAATRVVLVAAVAWISTRISGRLLGRLRFYTLGYLKERREDSTFEMEKRAATIITSLRKLVNTAIWIIALAVAFGARIESLLAGFGVAGLALGLGAQTLIKDWLGGLFLLLEDQIRIGDWVTINNFSGTVTELNLRTTVLRAENGAVHTIPNGSITALSNLTREFSYYIFETTLAHKADAVHALEILANTGAEVAAEDQFRPFVLGPIEIMGVEKLGDRGAVIRARVKTVPSKQYLVGRELNLRVKQYFDGAGIEFPPAS